MGAFVDLRGQKFGKLVVVEQGKAIGRNNGKQISTWLCKCECGNMITVRGAYLKSGHTVSCGCARKDNRPKTFEDLTGKKFGNLTVVRYLTPEERTTKTYNWLCKCDCGNTIFANASKLKDGHTKSCGCLRKKAKGRNYEDLTGKHFNHLTVIRELKPEERKARSYNWLCRCDCGKEFQSTANKIKTGTQISCGCLRAEKLKNASTKYKYSNKRLYSVYKAMLSRCINSADPKYKEYGARGITVCSEWQGENGYDVFAEWAFQNGYDPNAERLQCTLDRKNVNGNYEPSNCRWISNDRQQNNRRDCHYIEYMGKTQSLADWARELKIPYKYMEWRVIAKNNNHKMTIQECVDSFYNK